MNCVGGQDAARPALALTVRAGVDSIEFGQGFDVTVVREWRKDLVPDDWSDASVAPLVVGSVLRERHEDATHVVETIRYRCFAFARDDVIVPATVMRARAPSVATAEEFTVTGNALELSVVQVVDAKSPGRIELPSGLMPLPSPPIPWWFGAIAFVAVIAMVVGLRWFARVRRRPRVAVRVPPHEAALTRLALLRDVAPEIAWLELSALLRLYLHRRFALPALDLTTEELDVSMAALLVAAPTTPLAPHRAWVTAVLARCDLVKFAGTASDPDSFKFELDATERFVNETRDESAQASVAR